MAPTAKTAVTLSGRSLDTNSRLRFDVEDLGEAGKGTQVTLDPDMGGTGEDGWKEFRSYVFFGAAACFELRASSPNSSWLLRFGFGR